MEKNWRTIAFYFMIFIIVILSIYLFFFIRSESYQCINNSAKYFIDKVDKANAGTTHCSCFVLRNGSSTQFTLDSNGIQLENINTQIINTLNTNLS